jgi:hypothetical protein
VCTINTSVEHAVASLNAIAQDAIGHKLPVALKESKKLSLAIEFFTALHVQKIAITVVIKKFRLL